MQGWKRQGVGSSTGNVTVLGAVSVPNDQRDLFEFFSRNAQCLNATECDAERQDADVFADHDSDVHMRDDDAASGTRCTSLDVNSGLEGGNQGVDVGVMGAMEVSGHDVDANDGGDNTANMGTKARSGKRGGKMAPRSRNQREGDVADAKQTGKRRGPKSRGMGDGGRRAMRIARFKRGAS